jgi:hypothetical protein
MDEGIVRGLSVNIPLPPFRRKLKNVTLKRDITSELLPC